MTCIFSTLFEDLGGIVSRRCHAFQQLMTRCQLNAEFLMLYQGRIFELQIICSNSNLD